MPATSYPGTVTPLRGLNAFAESERDVLFGRDNEREDLARLVSAEGYRAGLLYGESGVGKTSLLRAGLVPHLRDHGVVALLCEDIHRPEESFARAIGQAAGVSRGAGEQPLQFLSRILADAVGQIFLFIVDEADIALSGPRGGSLPGASVGSADDRVVNELGELFARVVARSAGRARFLFSCASERLHVFGALERRTGSLFPPSSRYELGRFTVEQAAFVLERTLLLAGASADPQMARAIAAGLGHEGTILPADLQIAALAVVQLGVSTPVALHKLGGPRELEAEWLRRAARATGDERAALRLLAELGRPASMAAAPAPPQGVRIAAARASVDVGFARRALAVLQDKGVTRAVRTTDEGEARHSLAHEIMGPRVREVAAPARVSARRTFELLGSKAARNRRLTLREWYGVWREGVSPSTPAERAVLERTRRTALIAIAVALAAPIVFLLGVWLSMSGRYYLAAAAGKESAAGPMRVVVRQGRAGLSAFHWLPGGFGNVVADTGFTRSMIDPGAWEEVARNQRGGDLDDAGFARQVFGLLRPELRGLMEYAATGSETALDGLTKSARTPDELVSLLTGLLPIARGLPQEVALVESALAELSPVVQSSALALAAAAERRRPGTYRPTLVRALASQTAQLRRLAVAAARRLPDGAAQGLFKEALGLAPDVAARRELGTLIATDPGAAPPSAASALAMLAQASHNPAAGKPETRSARNAAAGARERARSALRRAFATSPGEATTASAKLVGDENAPPDDRVFALELLRELAPLESAGELIEPAKLARDSKIEVVRAAALPLYARVAPQEAAGDLALMLENQALSPAMKVAMALAWGEVATRGKNKAAAQAALATLIEDPSSRVRAAAAEAYGSVGRPAQPTLAKMVRGSHYEIAVGAAYGLARSAEAGGSIAAAVSGVYPLWKQKGRSRRDAARVYARLARSKPAAVSGYLATASTSTEDSELRPIGIEGLCNAMLAGERSAVGDLARAARTGSAEVRRLVIQCLSDNPKFLAPAARIALELSADPDQQNRTEAARLLAQLAGHKASADVGEALARLARDEEREVRIIAIRALAAMGEAAPRQAVESLPRAYDRADETERLVILEAAQKIGAGELARIGVTDASPMVRVAAVETALATRTDVATIIQSALSDPDPAVRRAAVERLAGGTHALPAEEVERALGLAARDRDEQLSVLALTALARVAEPAQMGERLGRLLASSSERQRAHAAMAARGLAQRDPKLAIALLEPVYGDPSHDVRAAMMPSLATAYASSRKPTELAAMLNASETAPTRRLVVAAAFLILASNPAAQEDAVAALQKVASEGPPLARLVGHLSLGLISSSADGLSFLTELLL